MVLLLIGYKFNFVFVNRYNDGIDYMGEYRDDEVDLVVRSVIVLVLLG